METTCKKNNKHHIIGKKTNEDMQDNDDHYDITLLNDVRISKPNRIVKYRKNLNVNKSVQDDF